MLKNAQRTAALYLLSAVTCLVLFLGSGCDGGRETLLVHCGAGLRPPVSEALEIFQARSGIQVETNYAASNMILGQLTLRPEGDIFIPGDEFYVQEARKAGHVVKTRPLALFVPVIMVERGNPLAISSLDDLAGEGIRLGMADERSAALGRITAQVISRNRLDREKLAANTVYTAATAHDLASAVALGHVDAALVWKPVALEYPEAAIIEIPDEQNVVSPIKAGLLTGGAENHSALELLDFLASEEVAAIFEKHNYRTR